MNLVEQAITEHWGPPCPEYERGCPVCDAWREYEDLVIFGEILVDEMTRPPIDPEARKLANKLLLEP